MRKNLKINLLLLFLFFQFIFSLFMIKENFKYKNIVNKTEIENICLKQEIKQIKQNSLYHYKIKGNRLNQGLVFKDRVGVGMDLEHFLVGTDFILYIPRQTCPSCYEDILERIPDIRKMLNDRLKIICFRDDIRKVTVYSQIKEKEDVVFYVNQGDLFPGINNLPHDIPFIFRITPDLKIDSLFLTDKNDIEYLLDYFKICSSL